MELVGGHNTTTYGRLCNIYKPVTAGNVNEISKLSDGDFSF
jgi:hypothetical protein